MNKIFHSVDWNAIHTVSFMQGVTYIGNMQKDYPHSIMLHNHDDLPLPVSLPTWGYPNVLLRNAREIVIVNTPPVLPTKQGYVAHCD